MKTSYEYNRERIRQCRASMAYNGDISLWQSKARAKLTELLGINNLVKAEPKIIVDYSSVSEEYKEIRFSFESEVGYRVPCHLLLPNGKEKSPVMICLQGHSTGMHISLARVKYERDVKSISGGDRDFAVRAVKKGFAAVALEQRNFGECGGKPGETDCFESSLTALLMGRTTVGERVWDVMRLIDVLEESFSDVVDIGCICCMGNSGGGTATAYIAALEDRIKLAMPSSAMCTYKDSIGAMNHCACNYVPHIAEYFDMSDLMAMSCPKYFVQVSGRHDPIFPIEPARLVFEKGLAAYEDTQNRDKAVFIEGEEGHRFYADPAWRAVHSLLNR